MSTFADNLARFEDATANGTGYLARCPAHEDRVASLSITEGDDGRTLLHCHADCSTEAITEAAGLRMADLFDDAERPQRNGHKSIGRASKPNGKHKANGKRTVTPSGNLVATYDYKDASGELVYQVLRYAMPDGSKTFKQRRPDGKGGWTWNLKGVTPLPYRLPELLSSTDPVFITEGEKDADRLALLNLIATCNSGGAGKWRDDLSQHLAGRDCIILADNDDPGRRHAHQVAQSLDGIASSIRVVELPDLPPKGDLSDWLDAGHDVEELMTVCQVTAEWEGTPDENGNDHDPRIDGRIPIGVTPDEHIVIAKTLDALAADDSLYHRAGDLVHVVRQKVENDDDGIRRSAGTPRIIEMSSGYLRERMARRCWFYKLKAGADGGPTQVQCNPPGFAVNSIHTRGHWPSLRLLAGITEIPVLRRDGTLICSPGYDEDTGLRYEPEDVTPTVNESPSWDDATDSACVMQRLVVDFPFAGDAHKAAWLAGLLTVLGRRAFSGPAPLFLLDANIRGSGKSLLTDVISIIATGRAMPRFSNPRDDDEARKRITALALAGDPLILIDNITSTLGSGALDAALTSTIWKDRRLGTNEIVECPLRAVWFATGNNVILKADTSRRCCHVRLESSLENPEERQDFEHPDLLSYVRSHRLELLTAGLTILRGYIVAGRPDAKLKPWGSFEGWSHLVRNAVVWCGMADPGETRQELAEAADRDAVALRALFAGWQDIDPDGLGLTSAELCRVLSEPQNQDLADALAELCGADVKKGLTSHAIGYALRRFKGRVMDRRRLEYHEGRTKAKAARWCVTRLDGNQGDWGHEGHVSASQ